MVDAAGPAVPGPAVSPPELLDTHPGRRLVLVVGSGRSGTTTLAGSLQALGMHVPQPEVAADRTNPKGFAESQWVVDLHEELLERCNVAVADARPSAWFDSGRLNNLEPLRNRIHQWLEQQFVEGGPELVVKDPRLMWFLGPWRAAALRCDARTGYVTMLRPVTEVVGSVQRVHDAKVNEVHRTASWVSTMLHCERATRGADRAFVRYHDLLDDWTVPVFGLGQRFDLDAVKSASANDIRKVHQYVDPSLRRTRLTWDDLEVPRRLREVAQETWAALDRLPDEGGDTPEVRETLDQLRTAYTELYDEAEAVAQSTAEAARRAGAAEAALVEEPGAARRTPHRLRAMLPAPVRRGARRALGRERP